MRNHARRGNAAGGEVKRALPGWILAAATPLILAVFYVSHPPRWYLPPPSVGPPSGGGPSLPTEGLLSAAALVALVLAAAAWGSPLMRRWAPAGRTRLEELLLAEGMGLAILGLLTLLLGEASLLGRATLWIIITVPFPWALYDWLKSRARAKDPHLPRRRPDSLEAGPFDIREARALRLASAVLIAGLLAVSLLLALAPLTANDALVYHLDLPQRYLAAGSTEPLTWNVYSRMPHNMEILYTLARGLGGEAAPRLLHWWMRVLFLASGFALVRRGASVTGAWLAVALLAGVPLISDPRAIGNIDLGMAFFAGLALIAWSLRTAHADGRTEGGGRSALLAGLFLGFMAGMRYTGLAYVPALAVVWVLSARRGESAAGEKEDSAPRERTALPWREAVVLIVAALVVFLPWMVRGELRSGNPVYPLLWSELGGIEWGDELSRQLMDWQGGMGMGRSLGDYLLLPWNLNVRAEAAFDYIDHLHMAWGGGPDPQAGGEGRFFGYRRFDGVVGPLFLILPLLWAVSGRRNVARERRLLLFLLLGFASWAAGPQQLRFALPLLLPAACLAAGALDGAERVPGNPRPPASGERLLARLGPYLILAAGFLGLSSLGSVAVGDALPALTGGEGRAGYIARHLPSYEAHLAANRHLPPDARLLLIWENRAYYLERPYLADSFFEASRVMALASESRTPAALARRLRERGITHVMYNASLGSHFMTDYPLEPRRTLARFGETYLEPLMSVGGVGLFALRDNPDSSVAR